MKNLNNIGKPVPEPADPPLIKPVTDVLEEIDAILGAPVGDLDTSDQTVVGAINELVDAIEVNATNISLSITLDGNIKYAKLANGVMIMFGQIALAANEASKEYTYVIPFVSGWGWPHAIITNVFSSSANIVWSSIANYTKLTVFPRMLTTGGTPTVSSVCDVVLIGRWK